MPPRVLRLHQVVLACALVLHAALVWRFEYLLDDAYISLRYARNLAEGHGLRYNVAEGAPVEGFSNLLWVLILAAFRWIGGDPVLLARILPFGCALALLALVYRYAKALVGPLYAALGIAVLAVSPPFAIWSTGGLETMAFALVCFLLYVCLAPSAVPSSAWLSAIGSALLVLLRVDGFVFVGMIAAATWAVHRREDGVRRKILASLACASLVLAVLTIWRSSYFGDWQPNTVRTKVELSSARVLRGGTYAASFLLTFIGPLVVLAGSMLVRKHADVRRAAALALLVFLYAAFVGGDWMPMGRLFVPALPLLAILASRELAWIGERWGRVPCLGATIGLIALTLPPGFGLHVLPEGLYRAMNFRGGGPPRWQSELAVWQESRAVPMATANVGRAMRLYAQPDESIVLGVIGALGYYSRITVYDSYGLTSREGAELTNAPGAEGKPGHDINIPFELFEKYRPTYFGARLVSADPSQWTLPESWSDPDSPARERFEIRTYPLPADQGFPEGKLLQLIRFRREGSAR